MKVGDKVGYSRAFLKSIHASATDPIWREQGTIECIKDFGPKIPKIVYVRGFQTENEDGLAHVNIKNLAILGSVKHVDE